MKTFKVSKEQVRQYLLAHSFLTQKAQNLHQVFERLKCIQVDPINIIARNHEFILWNRVQNYNLESLYHELYQTRSLFEYWLQLFSIIPIQYYPYLKPLIPIYQSHYDHTIIKKYQIEVNATLDLAKQNEFISSKDLIYINEKTDKKSWGRDLKTIILEYLWDQGKLMISHRQRNHKHYSLVEKIINQKYLTENISLEDSLSFLVESDFYYTGVLRLSFLNRKSYSKRLKLKKIIQKLINQGKVVKLEIPSLKADYFILSKQLRQLQLINEKHKGINILSPLDPLIIDRQITRDFFDFDYVWEAYLPAAKRKFGFYGMPTLFRGELVGQVELKRSKNGKIVIANQRLSNQTTEFKKALQDKLNDLEIYTKYRNLA